MLGLPWPKSITMAKLCQDKTCLFPQEGWANLTVVPAGWQHPRQKYEDTHSWLGWS